MMRVWMVNETFTHGFLVFPLSVWMIWQKRYRIITLEPTPEPRIILLLAALLAVWLVSSAVGVNIVQQFCMVSIIIATVWIVVGRQLLFYLLFPLIFLYFAVPFGQVFIPYLMQYTANFTVMLIKLSGIPVYQDGLSFILPTGSWSVVEECSGVRYLIASLTLGSIYAYLKYSSARKRLIFILLSLVVPIIGNGLRAFGIVMIGHFSGMELAVGADHLLYGWVFFGIIIMLLFYAGSFWWDAEEQVGRASDKIHDVNNGRKIYSPTAVLIITLITMIPLIVFSGHINTEKQKTVNTVALQLPVNMSGWQYDANRMINWQPVFVNPDTRLSRGYFLGKDFVQLNIAYYQTQRDGAEAVSTNNKITSPYGGNWKLIYSKDIRKNDMDFTESELKNSDEKLLVWSWYRVGEYETSNPYIAKALEAYNLIIEGRSDAALLTIATRYNDTKQVARQRIYDFWKKATKDISNELEQVQINRQA
jgi:exosortase A